MGVLEPIRLPPHLAAFLPAVLPAERMQDYVMLSGSASGLMGETLIARASGSLVVLSRSTLFGAFAVVPLSARDSVRIESRGFDTKAVIAVADGSSIELSVSPGELENLRRVLGEAPNAEEQASAWTLEQPSVEPEPQPAKPEPISDEGLEELIRHEAASVGLISAIKLYRMRTGVGLAEAKKAVDALVNDALSARNEVGENADEATGQILEEIQTCLSLNGKIAAIKRYRELTRAGLAEAKDVVESLERERLVAKSGEGPNAQGVADLANQKAVSPRNPSEYANAVKYVMLAMAVLIAIAYWARR